MALGPNDARGGLHLFEKMLAFLREAVDFVDSLRSRSDGQGPVEEEKQAEARGAQQGHDQGIGQVDAQGAAQEGAQGAEGGQGAQGDQGAAVL